MEDTITIFIKDSKYYKRTINGAKDVIEEISIGEYNCRKNENLLKAEILQQAILK